MQLKVNDEVKWTSQAAGHAVEKVGHVVEVVPAGAQPVTKLDRPGASRDHESYVVRARKPNGRVANYWPKVKYLQYDASLWTSSPRTWNDPPGGLIPDKGRWD
jgi:hypothetical protein